jgi:hypothetical protein
MQGRALKYFTTHQEPIKLMVVLLSADIFRYLHFALKYGIISRFVAPNSAIS